MNIQIRHTEARDTIALQEIYGQAESYFGTLQIPYPAEDDWKERFESIPFGSKSLVAEVDGKVVGHAAVTCRSTSPRRKHVGELGMAVHNDWKRKGVGAALVEALIDLAENWMNLTRLELTVYVDNTAAISLYEKYTFKVEGTHREFAFRDGQYVDALCMARLKSCQ